MSPNGDRLYVTNDDDNQLTVIDIPQNKIIKRIPIAKEPEGVSVSPDGHWIIATSESDNVAQWIDGNKLDIADSSTVEMRPRSSLFTPDGQQLWVSSEKAADLTVFDVETKRKIKTIRFEIPGVAADTVKPVGIRIDKKRRFGYVALGRANRVAVIDAGTLEALEYLLVGQRVWNLEFSPDQKRLYAANGLSGDISIINLDNRQDVKSIAVGQYPWGIAVKP